MTSTSSENIVLNKIVNLNLKSNVLFKSPIAILNLMKSNKEIKTSVKGGILISKSDPIYAIYRPFFQCSSIEYKSYVLSHKAKSLNLIQKPLLLLGLIIVMHNLFELDFKKIREFQAKKEFAKVIEKFERVIRKGCSTIDFIEHKITDFKVNLIKKLKQIFSSSFFLKLFSSFSFLLILKLLVDGRVVFLYFNYYQKLLSCTATVFELIQKFVKTRNKKTKKQILEKIVYAIRILSEIESNEWKKLPSVKCIWSLRIYSWLTKFGGIVISWLLDVFEKKVILSLILFDILFHIVLSLLFDLVVYLFKKLIRCLISLLKFIKQNKSTKWLLERGKLVRKLG